MKQAELDASKVCFNEKCLQRNKLQEDIRRKQEETTAFMHKFQETYDNETVNVSYISYFYKRIFLFCTCAIKSKYIKIFM